MSPEAPEAPIQADNLSQESEPCTLITDFDIFTSSLLPADFNP